MLRMLETLGMSGFITCLKVDSPGSSWQHLGQDIDGEAAWNYSGSSAAFSSDANILAIDPIGMTTMEMNRVM